MFFSSSETKCIIIFSVIVSRICLYAYIHTVLQLPSSETTLRARRRRQHIISYTSTESRSLNPAPPAAIKLRCCFYCSGRSFTRQISEMRLRFLCSVLWLVLRRENSPSEPPRQIQPANFPQRVDE